MNFGESLAYWYFRLNGFIPMPNFVLHEVNGVDMRRKYNADADLLAVRFPHVFEEIGGRPGDWDNEQFAEWGLDLDREMICLICEVKTGEFNSASVNKAFNKARLLYAVRRFGILKEEPCRSVRDDLLLSSVVYQKMGQAADYVRQAGFDPIQQEQMVLQYVRAHGRIARKDTASLCRISSLQASYLLRKLSAENKLRSEGSGRGTYYVLP